MKTSITPKGLGTGGILLLILWLSLAGTQAATTINVSTNVATASVKRMGMNLSFNTYYDSRLMMKELCFRNPGFEGQIYQSVVRVAASTATNCTDDMPFGGWTNGFWNGASFEVIWGTAKGRTGVIADYLRPTNQTFGSFYQFAQTGTAPGVGDYFIIRKPWLERPESGWNTSGTNYVITSELADLPSDTTGKQALHVASTNSPANFSLTSTFDAYPGMNFILLNGRYRVTFKAKSLAGTAPLNVIVRRTATYLNTNVSLTSTWTTFTLDFDAAEVGSAPGVASLQFNLFTSFNVLLDDVSLKQIDSDPTNKTAFRDAVVKALREYRPGILRGLQEIQGDNLENQLSSVWGRQRAGYSLYGTVQNNIQYSYHELLELAEAVDAEPWLTVPIVFTPQEMSNLIEYLTGPTNTIYGARRAAMGHPAPWSDVFRKIHLEYGNEAWNGFTYFGGTIVQSVPYGNRASELFSAARNSPSFVSNKFDLVLGAHAPETIRNMNIHNACTNHDTLTVDGYFYTRVDNFANNEEMFGPMFAQVEQFNRTGYMMANYTNLLASSRPVNFSIYEGNLNTTQGTIMTNNQAALDIMTPSLGTGLAVGNDMLMKLRDLKMRDQCLFNLGGFSTGLGSGSKIWGVTRDMGVTDRKRPQFLALALVNDLIDSGADLLATSHTGDNPTWSQIGTNSTTLADAHHLSSYAFASGTRRAIVVFNLHRSSSLDINFSGSNAPSGNVTLKRLTSANITDNNENALVIVPTTNTLANVAPAQSFTLPPYSMSVLEWTVGTAPSITLDPFSQVVLAGSDLTLAVLATGTLPLHYQWQFNHSPLPGETNNILALTKVTRANTGGYMLTVSNAYGVATSQTAIVRVLNPARMQRPQVLPNGALRLLFGDQNDLPLATGHVPYFEVWASTDLSGGAWVKLNDALTVTNGLLMLDDSDAANHPQRYYRIVEK